MRSDKLAIIPPKDSDPIYYELNLHNYHDYLRYLQNIVNKKWKDMRLELVDISKGLIEVLQNTGFTIEMILEYGPSKNCRKIRNR